MSKLRYEPDVQESFVAGMSVDESYGVRDDEEERQEELRDIAAYEKAMEEYRRNPVSYGHDAVKEMLGVD